MTWLATVLTKHSEPAESDLARVYGIDLADFYRGRISPRALSVRLRHLPDGSALWRSLHSDLAWNQTDYLIARAVDALNAANWQRAGGNGNPPKPIQRPADRRDAANKDIKNRARMARWLKAEAERAARGGEG